MTKTAEGGAFWPLSLLRSAVAATNYYYWIAGKTSFPTNPELAQMDYYWWRYGLVIVSILTFLILTYVSLKENILRTIALQKKCQSETFHCPHVCASIDTYNKAQAQNGPKPIGFCRKNGTNCIALINLCKNRIYPWEYITKTYHNNVFVDVMKSFR